MCVIMFVCWPRLKDRSSHLHELPKYWEKFFQNYKYGPKEKEAIGLAVAEFC